MHGNETKKFIESTAARLTPESLAPRHNPVDIPPQPEKRSNSAKSAPCVSQLGTFSKKVLVAIVWMDLMPSGDDTLWLLTELSEANKKFDYINIWDLSLQSQLLAWKARGYTKWTRYRCLFSNFWGKIKNIRYLKKNSTVLVRFYGSYGQSKPNDNEPCALQMVLFILEMFQQTSFWTF